MDNKQMCKIAREAVYKHIGDVCDGDESVDVLAEEVYTLAFDALVDAGVATNVASDVAQSISVEYTAGME